MTRSSAVPPARRTSGADSRHELNTPLRSPARRERAARFFVDGVEKHYIATDHLETPNLRSLTPDDVLDIADSARLKWSSEAQKGPVFHLLSGVAVAGRLGVTAIADSAQEALSIYSDVENSLTAAAAH
jgi:PGM1 C-terminal domain